MKKNNSGFTLVELLVVVAILGLVIGLVALSTSNAQDAKNRSSIGQMNSLVTKCRTSTMSRAGEVYLEISLNSQGEPTVTYHENGTSETTVIGSSNTPLSIAISTRPNQFFDFRAPSNQTLVLGLFFDRNTGAQKEQGNEIERYYITFISIGDYTIELVPETGSHRLLEENI